MSEYLQYLNGLKNGTVVKTDQKKIYVIPKISEKKKQELKQEKPDRELKQNWFEARRKELTGTCQCGCGNPTQKSSDEFYRHCCCHIFPKALFPSIAYHPLNFIERAFIGGCHTNMDEQSIENWRGFEDWEIIKQKAQILAPLLPKEEKSKKFYRLLMDLIESENKKEVA